MASSAVIGWRILFILLGCTMVATLLFTIITYGSPFRRQLLSPLMVATLIDFYINIIVLAAWVSYKESNLIAAAIWIVFLVCFGSIATCVYILWQLWQLSAQESFEDIMYHVLIKNPNEKGMEQHRKQSNVMIAKVIFSALGCLMVVNVAYFFIDGGSPFCTEYLTPWMVATLIDFYINGATLSVWMFYKEDSWLIAIFWIVLFIIFGSASSCCFIVKELFKLNPEDPVYLVLFKSSNRLERRYERTSSS